MQEPDQDGTGGVSPSSLESTPEPPGGSSVPPHRTGDGPVPGRKSMAHRPRRLFLRRYPIPDPASAPVLAVLFVVSAKQWLAWSSATPYLIPGQCQRANNRPLFYTKVSSSDCCDLLSHGIGTSIRELEAGLGDYFWSYNHERPHQALGYPTPAEVYSGSLEAEYASVRAREVV
jgi:hypothetical protein